MVIISLLVFQLYSSLSYVLLLSIYYTSFLSWRLIRNEILQNSPLFRSQTTQIFVVLLFLSKFSSLLQSWTTKKSLRLKSDVEDLHSLTMVCDIVYDLCACILALCHSFKLYVKLEFGARQRCIRERVIRTRTRSHLTL